MQEVGPQIGPPVAETIDCGNWAVHFCPFSVQHLVVVGACALIAGIIITLGCRWRGTNRERLLRRALGVSVIITQGTSEFWWLLITPFEKGESLPLHLCDVAIWTVAIAMFTEKRWARAVVYFMGFALSTQGFLTPTLQDGYTHVKFWFFWIGHTQIVGSAMYFVIVSGFRPAWRDFKVAALVTIGWFLFVFTLNMIIGTNYGYVGRSDPSAETIVQKLGPWPWRVLIMCFMAYIAYMGVWMVGAGVAKFEAQRGKA